MTKIGGLLLMMCWLSAASAVAPAAAIDRQTAALLVPILDLRYEAVKNPDEARGSPFWRMGGLLYRLSKNQSPAADRALVVLLGYYLGEATNYDLLHYVTVRGKRMLPYLILYCDSPPRIPRRNYPASMKLGSGTRRDAFQEAIEAIKRGEVLNPD